MEEYWIGLFQVVYQSIKEEEWTDMHVLLKDISKKIGVEKAAQKGARLGKLAWRKTLGEDFFPPRKSRSASSRQEVCAASASIFVNLEG